MLDLTMHQTRYKKQANGILLAVAVSCIAYFLVSYGIGYSKDATDHSILILFTLLMGVVCIASLVVTIAVINKTYQISVGKSKNHFKIEDDTLYLKSPLDYKATEISLDDITAVKLTITDNLLTVILHETKKSKFSLAPKQKLKYRAFLHISEQQKLVSYLQTNHPNIGLTILNG